MVRAAKSCGVPVVQTLHNFRLFCPNGILLRDGQVCEECPHHGLHCALKHSCYRGSKAQTLVVVAAYWLHRILGTWRGVTMAAPTEFDREKLLEFNKIYPMFDANRLVVKPNPVCVPNGPVTPWDERKRQFVFAGRLEELKGIRTVIEAWRILDKNAPELLVAGNGPLADWAKAQKLPKVRFLGQLPWDELHRIIGESRAVVGASLCYESFALVPAEAHALGTPVLASGIGNMGASVRPGFDGLCFAPGDAAALAGAVRAMSAMQFDCAAIAAATRRRFGEEENYKTLMDCTDAAPPRNDMNQFYRALHMPPKRLLRKVMGEKRSIYDRSAPPPHGRGHRAAARPGRRPPTRCCPAARAGGSPTRCSATGAASAGCLPRRWTFPPAR